VQAGRPAAIRKVLRDHGGIESVQEESEWRIRCKLAAGPLLIVRLTDRAGPS
jgi:hypothetical protein